MKQALINSELSVTYPNSFRDMELAELQLSFGTAYKSMWGIRDDKHSMIVAVIWKEAGKLLQKLVSTKSLAQKYEKDMQKALQSDDYALDTLFEREIAGQEAQCFSYTYTRDGVKQHGETTVFRRGRCNYTLYYYTQARKAGANRTAYEKLLSSLELA